MSAQLEPTLTLVNKHRLNEKKSSPAKKHLKNNRHKTKKNNHQHHNHNHRTPSIHESVSIDHQKTNLYSENPAAHLNAQLQQYESLFVNQISKKCGMLLQWTIRTDFELLAEQLWKNGQSIIASQKYPQLNNYEINRLVERDWRYMGDFHRKNIIQKMVSSASMDEERVMQGIIQTGQVIKELMA